MGRKLIKSSSGRIVEEPLPPVLNVYPGCLIRACFDFISSSGDKEIVATVTKVTPRAYGNPLIETNLWNPNLKQYQTFDALFVKEILARPKQVSPSLPKENPFSKEAFCIESRGNKWKGYLISLVYRALSLIPAEYPVGVRVRKKGLWDLYKKQYLGLISMDEYGQMIVRKKVFLKWVRANRTRLLTNREERIREVLDKEEWWEEMYYEDLEREMENNL